LGEASLLRTEVGTGDVTEYIFFEVNGDTTGTWAVEERGRNTVELRQIHYFPPRM